MIALFFLFLLFCWVRNCLWPEFNHKLTVVKLPPRKYKRTEIRLPLPRGRNVFIYLILDGISCKWVAPNVKQPQTLSTTNAFNHHQQPQTLSKSILIISSEKKYFSQFQKHNFIISIRFKNVSACSLFFHFCVIYSRDVRKEIHKGSSMDLYFNDTLATDKNTPAQTMF